MTENEIKSLFSVTCDESTKKIRFEIDAKALTLIKPQEKEIVDPFAALKNYAENLTLHLEDGNYHWSVMGTILDDISDAIEESSYYDGVIDFSSDDIDFY